LWLDLKLFSLDLSGFPRYSTFFFRGKSSFPEAALLRKCMAVFFIVSIGSRFSPAGLARISVLETIREVVITLIIIGKWPGMAVFRFFEQKNRPN